VHDYVIVGAGSAGCVLASRLTEDPRVTVLLIEAGPPDTPKEIHIPAAFGKVLRTERDWAFRTVAQPQCAGREMYWPRGKTLGGSSSINAQIYMRGHPSDYDGWAASGLSGWGWADVLPWFRKAEGNSRGVDSSHGAGGPLAVSDLRDPNPLMAAICAAGVEAGLTANRDFNAGTQDGIGFNQVTQRRGARCSTAVGYLRPARGRPNLEVRTGCQVRGVLFRERRAYGVEIEADGRVAALEARREVLLAAGAIGSPQLLMLSGVGPAQHLRDLGIGIVIDHPDVGQHLEDHVCVALMWEVTEPLSLLAAERLPEVLRYLLLRKGMLTSNVAEVCAFVRTRAGLGAPDLQLHFAPVYFDTNLEEEPAVHAVTAGPVLLQPRSTGTIRLASSDPSKPPLIDPGFLSDPEGADMATLILGVQIARRIVEQPAFARYRGSELHPGAAVTSDEAIAEFVRRRASTLYHPVGTCRMGADPGSVVDPELRVRGLTGLRVVDASVMPRIVRGNTNAPTIMIAEKAASLIASA